MLHGLWTCGSVDWVAHLFELAFFEMLVQRLGGLLNWSVGVRGVAVQHIDLPCSVNGCFSL